MIDVGCLRPLWAVPLLGRVERLAQEEGDKQHSARASASVPVPVSVPDGLSTVSSNKPGWRDR